MKIKTVIVSVISIAAIVIVVFAIAYVSNLSMVDPLLPIQLRESRELKRAQRYFPKTISGYSLMDDSGQGVRIMDSCNKIEDNDVLKETGRTGNACVKTYTAIYGNVISSTTSTSTSKIIRINLSRFTEAADMLELLVEKTTSKDVLNNKPIFRTAPFRLGWSPISGFDLIMTEESKRMISSTTDMTEYSGVATGDSEVTKYFISKYPPSSE